MGLNSGNFRARRGHAAAIVLAAAILAAGATSSDGATLFQRLFGGGKSSSSSAAPPNALVVNPDDLTAPDYCPELRLATGGTAYSTFDPSHDGDQNYIRFLGSIQQTARECLTVSDSGITMKIGVAGRVVAGPKGAPGKFTLPLRVTVIKQSTNVVLFNKAYTATFAVSPGGDLSADFSQVIDPVTFKRTAADEDLIVYVGFDAKKT